MNRRNALILDRHASIVAMQVCRAVARRGYRVDIFSGPGPAFFSKYCSRRLIAPSWQVEDLIHELRHVITSGRYDAVYFCSDEFLPPLLSLAEEGSLSSLPLASVDCLKTLQSKHTTLEVVRRQRVAVPRTVIPTTVDEVSRLADELGFPLLVKGERGEGGRNVLIVSRPQHLLPAYFEIKNRESAYGGRPALQEFITGTAYSVGGLFNNGQALRICAHRKLLTFPPSGGWTIKGVTERPPGLLEEAFKSFNALRFTGLGHAEFIRDVKDKEFKFIEINPRIWGSIGIAENAGVDFYAPYHALASGISVSPDLRYRLGVQYHHFSGEIHLILKRPQRLFGFLKDAFDPEVHSDFEWTDVGPHFSRLLFQHKFRRHT